jgi:hypothetical protein
VCGDELLLLPDRRQEAERVGAEADHADRRDREQPDAGGQRDLEPPAAIG